MAGHRNRRAPFPVSPSAQLEGRLSEAQPGHPVSAAQHLENLRLALRDADPELFARLVLNESERPHLHVNNPAGAGRFAEDIGIRQAATAQDSDHYVWSWGEEVTPVTTPEIAAVRIRRVLAVQREEA